jgi:hypothetical protein
MVLAVSMFLPVSFATLLKIWEMRAGAEPRCCRIEEILRDMALMYSRHNLQRMGGLHDAKVL